MWWHVGSSCVWNLATSRFLAVALFRLYFLGREGTLSTVLRQTFAMYLAPFLIAIQYKGLTANYKPTIYDHCFVCWTLHYLTSFSRLYVIHVCT